MTHIQRDAQKSVRKTQTEIVMRPYVHLIEKKKFLSLCYSPVLKLSHTPMLPAQWTTHSPLHFPPLLHLIRFAF